MCSANRSQGCSQQQQNKWPDLSHASGDGAPFQSALMRAGRRPGTWNEGNRREQRLQSAIAILPGFPKSECGVTALGVGCVVGGSVSVGMEEQRENSPQALY